MMLLGHPHLPTARNDCQSLVVTLMRDNSRQQSATRQSSMLSSLWAIDSCRGRIRALIVSQCSQLPEFAQSQERGPSGSYLRMGLSWLRLWTKLDGADWLWTLSIGLLRRTSAPAAPLFVQTWQALATMWSKFARIRQSVAMPRTGSGPSSYRLHRFSRRRHHPNPGLDRPFWCEVPKDPRPGLLNVAGGASRGACRLEQLSLYSDVGQLRLSIGERHGQVLGRASLGDFALRSQVSP